MSLVRYCDLKGFRFLAELDLNAIRDWRATWNVNSLVRQKRQGQVLGFLWFCERAGWLPRNYASDITRGLGRIQVKATQTGYFQPHEYKAIIDATYLYSDRPSIDKPQFPHGRWRPNSGAHGSDALDRITHSRRGYA